MSYERLNPEVFTDMQKHERSKAAGDLQKKILASMNNQFMGPQTIAWLQNMNEDVNVSGGLTGGSPNVVLTSVSILDKLFDEFQRYSYQYNQTEPNNGYVVSVRRPLQIGIGTERYEGFVFNSRIALLVIAVPDCITLNFVAPRFVYEQEQYRTVFKSFMRFESELVSDTQIWKLDGTKFSYAQLPTIAKKVFARLIRVTRNEVADIEPLKIDFNEPDLPTPPPVPEFEGQDDTVKPPTRIDIITDALMTLLENVDAEINDVEAQGIKSVRVNDQQHTNFLLQRSKDLRRFRDQGANMAKQWASILIGE